MNRELYSLNRLLWAVGGPVSCLAFHDFLAVHRVPDFLRSRERITDEQAFELALHLIGKKEASRRSPEWECPDATILALATAQQSIPDLRWLLHESIRSDFADHGFMEVWIADFTGYEAYETIELFGLYPSKWWGHHRRPNANKKPYG